MEAFLKAHLERVKLRQLWTSLLALWSVVETPEALLVSLIMIKLKIPKQE